MDFFCKFFRTCVNKSYLNQSEPNRARKWKTVTSEGSGHGRKVFFQPLKNPNILRIIVTHGKFLRIKAESYQITFLLNVLLKNVKISVLFIFVNLRFLILKYLFSCRVLCNIMGSFVSMHNTQV